MDEATAKKTFVLRDHGGDLSKKWFLHFKNPKSGKWEKFYEGINSADTVEGRVAAADLLRAKLLKSYKPPPPNEAQRGELYQALEAKRPLLRKKSFQSYQTKLNGLFDWLAGRVVDTPNLRSYFQHVESTHATGTAYDTFYTIKRILNYCGLAHLVGDYKPPQPTPEPLRYFQKHQQALLRKHMQAFDPDLLLWCEFVYYCFIRPRSELRFLQVHHILFDEAKILIPSAVSKNKKSQYVAIPDAFLPSLERLKERNPREYIFAGKDGKPTGYNTKGRHFTELLERLGFDTALYSVYSWKHSGAVDCVKAGISLKELQLQLRHHSLDQVDEYLRQLGLTDLEGIRTRFPRMGE